MSWFSSIVNILVNKEEDKERELTPTIYRKKYEGDESSSSYTESFESSDEEDEIYYAKCHENYLEQVEDIEGYDEPDKEIANEIYQYSDSEGIARSISPAPVYVTLERENKIKTNNFNFDLNKTRLEIRGPTPPSPDFSEYEQECKTTLTRRISSIALPENLIETKTKKLWGSFTKLAIPKTSTLKRKFSSQIIQGQSGFEDLRRHIKQGGDFSKELATILQERSEAEAQYAKLLAKLSSKLVKATKELGGTVSSTWHRIGVEMENESEIHRNFSSSLSENIVKPLKNLTDSQHRIRKSVEIAVDKSAKNLAEWRAAEIKAKKHSFVSARDNEKLRDGDVKKSITGSSLQISKTIPSEKDNTKLEVKRKKAEETVKKADVEYYNMCLRAERSRLEWESAVVRGSHCFEVMEDERLKGLKMLAELYTKGFKQIPPKLTQIGDRIIEPLEAIDITRDMQIAVNLKSATEPSHEQILPDFYPEQLTLAMNRERRKQSILKLLQLVKGDLERERRGKAGVENLVMAFKQTPTFTNDDSQYNVVDKLHHMRAMLAFLEATRYKLQSALSEIEGTPNPSHPLASHIQVSRDRQGYQQSTLKIPPWIHESSETPQIWIDRGTADGTAMHTDSDFDEFSSQESVDVETKPEGIPQKCKALYNYKAKLYDELNLAPGDIINIHDKQVDGWWLGELNGTVGIFPATYVEEL